MADKLTTLGPQLLREIRWTIDQVRRIVRGDLRDDQRRPGKAPDDYVIRTPARGLVKRSGSLLQASYCHVFKEEEVSPGTPGGDKRLVQLMEGPDPWILPIYNLYCQAVPGGLYVPTALTKSGTRYVLNWEDCEESSDSSSSESSSDSSSESESSSDSSSASESDSESSSPSDSGSAIESVSESDVDSVSEPPEGCRDGSCLWSVMSAIPGSGVHPYAWVYMSRGGCGTYYPDGDPCRDGGNPAGEGCCTNEPTSPDPDDYNEFDMFVQYHCQGPATYIPPP